MTATVAAVAVSGCGLSYEDFERAVDLAVERGTMRMDGEVVVSERGPDGEEDEFRVAMSGALDLRADRGEITMVFAGIEDEPVLTRTAAQVFNLRAVGA